MKLLSISLVIFAAACAGAPQLINAQDALDLIGTYCLENSDASMQLELSQDGGYVVYADAGTRTVGKATGNWTYENGELMLSQSDQTRGWHHYMSPITAKSRGGILVLSGDFKGSLVKRNSGGCEL